MELQIYTDRRYEHAFTLYNYAQSVETYMVKNKKVATIFSERPENYPLTQHDPPNLPFSQKE